MPPTGRWTKQPEKAILLAFFLSAVKYKHLADLDLWYPAAIVEPEACHPDPRASPIMLPRIPAKIITMPIIGFRAAKFGGSEAEEAGGSS